ncbi:MAG: hypothetical protein JO358_16755, partial [Alphaproteobacteria bacterium]|nr:hypothetical protein [Alphaproteobacteria bacterium]
MLAAICAIFGAPLLSMSGCDLSMSPLALTMGEPAGIGGEIALKAWLNRSDGIPAFYLLDDPDRIVALAQRLGWPVPVEPIGDPAEAVDAFARALPVFSIANGLQGQPGQPSPADAPAVLEAIKTG